MLYMVYTSFIHMLCRWCPCVQNSDEKQSQLSAVRRTLMCKLTVDGGHTGNRERWQCRTGTVLFVCVCVCVWMRASVCSDAVEFSLRSLSSLAETLARRRRKFYIDPPAIHWYNPAFSTCLAIQWDGLCCCSVRYSVDGLAGIYNTRLWNVLKLQKRFIYLEPINCDFVQCQ